ncbi:MAG: hypothetical protein V7776_22500 [Halopseudomonas aestusnigri]
MTGIISGSVTRDEVTAVEVPQFHPPEENLIDYVSGRGGDGWELVIDAHLSLCAACRAEIDRLKALGGALLEKLPAEDLPEGMEERVLDLLDSAEITTFPGSKLECSTSLPRSIERLLPDNFEDINWCTKDTKGTDSIGLPVQSVKMLLLRIPAGATVFLGQEQHTEVGQLLILTGGLVNEDTRLTIGDVKPLSELNEDFYSEGESSTTYCLLLVQDED